MGNGQNDNGEAESWLDRLEGGDFSEADGQLQASVLDPPIDAADAEEICRLLHGGETVAVRAKAAAALGAIAGSKQYASSVVEELRRAVLEDSASEVQARAIDSLYLYDPDNVDWLAEAIVRSIKGGNGDTDPGALVGRWLASDVSAFRLVGATAAPIVGVDQSSQLLEAFRDDDRRVRSRAVESYVYTDPDPDHEPVERMLRDASSTVRRTAASALVEIGTDRALEGLLSVTDASDDQLQRIAVSELHRLDRRRTARALVAGIDTGSETVRRRAMVSLMQLCATGKTVRHEDASEYLIERLDPSLWPDIAAIGSDVVATDTGATIDRDAQQEGVQLLGELALDAGRETVSCELVSMLGITDERIRELTAEYLLELDGEALEAELRAMSRDSSAPPEARQRASAILKDLKQSMAETVDDHDIEYTYISRPADYTEKHEE